MVSTWPPTSKSSRPFNNPLVTVPKAPITIGIIVTFMFHSLLNSLARSRYLSLFLHSFSFILWSAGTAKLTIFQVSFFVNYYKVWSSGCVLWLLLTICFLILIYQIIIIAVIVEVIAHVLFVIDEIVSMISIILTTMMIMPMRSMIILVCLYLSESWRQ